MFVLLIHFRRFDPEAAAFQRLPKGFAVTLLFMRVGVIWARRAADWNITVYNSETTAKKGNDH
jgi:hypothetical protein